MRLDDIAVTGEPLEIPILDGIVFIVRSMDLRSYSIAQAAAKQRLTGLEESVDQCKEAGLFDDRNLPDLENPIVREGILKEFLIIELGCEHIVSWSGILNNSDCPVEPTRDAIEAVLKNPFISIPFYDRLMRWQSKYLSAKKDSGTASDGILPQTAVPTIAPDANSKASLAPAAAADPAEVSAQT